MFSVVVAVENSGVRDLLCSALEEGSYHCYPAEDKGKVVFYMRNFHLDLLVISDRIEDALSLTRELQKESKPLPVILLLEEDRIEKKRSFFQAGADDCLVLPFEPEELLLRANAVLRRAGSAYQHQLRIGQMLVDLDALTVSTPEGQVVLPLREMRVLFKLLSCPEQTFQRSQLVEELWGKDATVDKRTIDACIRNIRTRLPDCKEFRLIAVRGVGYRAQILAE